VKRVLLLEKKDMCALVGGDSFERDLLYSYLCELFQNMLRSYRVEGVAYNVGDGAVEYFYDPSDFARYFCEFFLEDDKL